jgi:uncharacterized small protein (TIGR04563 family)
MKGVIIISGIVMSEKRKQGIYLPDGLLEELRAESARTDRPVAWLLQQAWRVARKNIADLPTMPGDRPSSSA